MMYWEYLYLCTFHQFGVLLACYVAYSASCSKVSKFVRLCPRCFNNLIVANKPPITKPTIKIIQFVIWCNCCSVAPISQLANKYILAFAILFLLNHSFTNSTTCGVGSSNSKVKLPTQFCCHSLPLSSMWRGVFNTFKLDIKVQHFVYNGININLQRAVVIHANTYLISGPTHYFALAK